MIMENIFKNIFNNAFGSIAEDTGLSLGSEESNSPFLKPLGKAIKKGIEKGGADLRKAFSRGLAKDKEKKKELASDNTKKINKNLRKDKDFTINKVISKRYYSRGSNGHYYDDDARMSIDEYDGEQEVEIPSTAIADVRYDPRSRVCYVRYTSGNKWYKFINMSPQQFRSFMNASSKGRYVQKVMRKKNYDPSFKK